MTLLSREEDQRVRELPVDPTHERPLEVVAEQPGPAEEAIAHEDEAELVALVREVSLAAGAKARNPRPLRRRVQAPVVYVPAAAGHRATAGIARGPAIVGRPDARREDVHIYYEGAVYGQSEMRTLADRAVYACGRMVDSYPTAAAMAVPREALVAVGTLDRTTSEIILTGDQSAAAVAEWLERLGSIPQNFALD